MRSRSAEGLGRAGQGGAADRKRTFASAGGDLEGELFILFLRVPDHDVLRPDLQLGLGALPCPGVVGDRLDHRSQLRRPGLQVAPAVG
eukprot:SAG31_NODE_1162_length_9594_cov_3.045498_11_plen_87_part_01